MKITKDKFICFLDKRKATTKATWETVVVGKNTVITPNTCFFKEINL